MKLRKIVKKRGERRFPTKKNKKKKKTTKKNEKENVKRRDKTDALKRKWWICVAFITYAAG